MTQTRTVTREDIYRRLQDLPDEKLPEVIAFIDSLEEGHEPNEETIRVLQDVEAGRNMIGPFHNIEDLMASLLADDDAGN